MRFPILVFVACADILGLSVECMYGFLWMDGINGAHGLVWRVPKIKVHCAYSPFIIVEFV